MGINLSALAPITTAAQSLSNLVLVTPQDTQGYAPQNPPKPDGTVSTAPKPPSLIFNYEGEQTITLESEVTNHYVEDNTAVQDQIALKPEIVTAKGYVGELNNVPPPGLALLKTAADRLTSINAYAPQISTTATLAYAEAFFLYQTAANVANTAVSAWSSIGNAFSSSGGQSVIGSSGLKVGTNQNKQQIMFQQFYGYWKTRTLFTVQTPWAVFQNMAILRLRAVQDEDSKVITDFEITFQMIRTASTQTKAGILSSSLDGRASSQASGLVDLGTSSPVPSINLSSGFAGMGL